MKENNKDEELVDIDENGNPIDKKEEKDKKSKPKSLYKIIISIIIFLIIILSCYFFFNSKNKIKNVFDKTTLKNLNLKNRIFFGPIIHDIQKIETIAQNDVALIITDGAIVGDYTVSKLRPENQFRIDDDKYIPEIKKLADIVHKHNSYILLDIVHMGLFAVEQPVYSPSGDKGLINKEIQSKEMTKEDILRIENYFVQSALRAKKAGYDGIEIHGAHLTLVSLFSFKKFNRRTDEYGGSDINRARFITEIVKKIREAVGNDMIISAKIDSPDEDNGFSEEGFLITAKELEKAGVDFIEISGANPIRKDEDIYFFDYAKKVADNVNIPVTCIGGIKTYEQADYILKNSKIEYIAMSRELLKKPDIVKTWISKK